MNFKSILSQILDKYSLTEASTVAAGAEKMERAKSNGADFKSRDAARKRAERAKQVPRDKKPKQDLLKEIIIVKTKSGATQLIFKDSFNASYHEKASDAGISMGEAQQAAASPNFEQTRASKLLFGEMKGKKEGEEKEKKKGGAEAKEREEARPKTADENTKAKKLSKDQMFQSMSQMNTEQLMGMPPDIRNEYFKMVRKPPANNDFDKLSYENLTVTYGLSNISSTPYNQQVLNALIFLSKIKTGASSQEMQTYLALAPDAREFTRAAFFSARKILSQIGDQCLQNLVTNIETVGKPVVSDGASDMQCGNYKFKVSAGGEISLSTTQFDQSNKSFKGYVSRALTQALSNPQLVANDPKLSAFFQKMKQGKENFSTTLIPDQYLETIKQNPQLLQQLQNTPITAPNGKVVGTIIDQEGNLNKLASLSYYQKAWQDGAKELMKNVGSKSNLKTSVINNLLKTVIRGDNITDPMVAPNYLITANGIFNLTDDYFNTVSKDSILDIKPAKDVITSSNIVNYSPSAAEMMKKFTTLVEAPAQQDSTAGLLIPRDSIEPINLMVDYIVKNNDFLLNATLLPGFKPKDLNAVQFNYVTVNGKTTKIPVMRGENITNEDSLSEARIILNDLLVESLTNNFVIAMLQQNSLINDSEAKVLSDPNNLLTENLEVHMINVQSIYENMIARMNENPFLYIDLIEDIVQEEYKRDYKKEYKNYHGKAKQRKERSARTIARELMKKKGKVKKGDGKDIDHKHPLRSGGSKGLNNLRVRDKSSNRSDNGHHKGEKQKKDSWK
jgi:hypothetical protein